MRAETTLFIAVFLLGGITLGVSMLNQPTIFTNDSMLAFYPGEQAATLSLLSAVLLVVSMAGVISLLVTLHMKVVRSDEQD